MSSSTFSSEPSAAACTMLVVAMSPEVAIAGALRAAAQRDQGLSLVALGCVPCPPSIRWLPAGFPRARKAVPQPTATPAIAGDFGAL
jgi:hypothetical protein